MGLLTKLFWALATLSLIACETRSNPEEQPDCRIAGNECADNLQCKLTEAGTFQCVGDRDEVGDSPEGQGGMGAGGDGETVIDCRNAVLECAPPFECRDIGDGVYDCVRIGSGGTQANDDSSQGSGGPELRVNPTSVSFQYSLEDVSFAPVTLKNVGGVAALLSDVRIIGSERFGVFFDSLSAETALEALRRGDPDPRCASAMDASTRDPRQTPTLINDPDEDGEDGLAPLKSVTLCMTFSGDRLTSADGILEIEANTQPSVIRVGVNSNSDEPCLRVTPERLNISSLPGVRNERLLTLESCGGTPVLVNGIEIIEGAEQFSIVAESLPAELPFALPGVENVMNPVRPSRAFSLAFESPEVGEFQGSLRVTSNDVQAGVHVVELFGRTSNNDCPVAELSESDRSIRVRPLDVVSLDASLSSDADGPNGDPTKYQWVVVSAPSGSTSQPVESFTNQLRPQDGGVVDDESTPFAFFWVDLIGDYELALTVVDEFGLEAPSAACQQPPVRMRIQAEPDEDLSVELVWNTPSDFDQSDGDGTDLDLHLAHPTSPAWFDRRLDCHYRNPIADWGNSDANNGTLDVDDTDGAGPEKISVLEPENTATLGGPYRVAVHYYSDSGFGVGIGGSFGASEATVKISLRGLMVEEFSQTLNNWDMWEVGGIEWTPSDRRFIESTAPLFEERPPGL